MPPTLRETLALSIRIVWRRLTKVTFRVASDNLASGAFALATVKPAGHPIPWPAGAA